MLQPHEVQAVNKLTGDLRDLGVSLNTEPQGPYGRMAEAINAYRSRSYTMTPTERRNDVGCVMLGVLIAIYSKGVCRGTPVDNDPFITVSPN